jgi:hypothetical protein
MEMMDAKYIHWAPDNEEVLQGVLDTGFYPEPENFLKQLRLPSGGSVQRELLGTVAWQQQHQVVHLESEPHERAIFLLDTGTTSGECFLRERQSGHKAFPSVRHPLRAGDPLDGCRVVEILLPDRHTATESQSPVIVGALPD